MTLLFLTNKFHPMPNFQQLYQSYTDTELMSAFSNRHQYTEEARTAMLAVIKERGLWEVAEKEIQRQEAEQAAAKRAQQKKFEEKMLGGHVSSDKEYARESLFNGEYMSGPLVGNNFRFARIFLVSLAIASTIMAVLSVTDRPFFPYSFELSAGATIAMLAIVVVSFRKSKGQYRLFRPDSGVVLEVKKGAYTYRARMPFSYFICWHTVDHRKGALKITHTIATLCITNKENESVAFVANLGNQSAPADWPHLREVTIPKGTRFFHETITHPLNVVKLKKILDGLHN